MVSLLLSACAAPTPTPTASPTLVAQATATATATPSIEPTATATAAPLATPSPGQVLAPSGKTMALADGYAATWGPHLYNAMDDPAHPGTVTVEAADLTTGATMTTAVPVQGDETVNPPDGFADPATWVATDGRFLALAVWHHVGPPGHGGVPCGGSEAEPVAWRILVAPLDAVTGRVGGPFAVFASGVSRDEFLLPGQGEGCGGPRTPRVSLSDGRIAYTIEAPQAAAPFAMTVVVRRLPDGVTVRKIAAPRTVVSLAMAGPTVVFTDSDDADAANPRWAIRASTEAHPATIVVATGSQAGAAGGYGQPPRVATDGRLVAWEVPLASASVTVLSDAAVTPLAVPGQTCDLGGVDGGLVSLGCWTDAWASEAVPGNQPITTFIWSAAGGPYAVVGGPAMILDYAPSVAGGWLIAFGGPFDAPSGTIWGFSTAGWSPTPQP